MKNIQEYKKLISYIVIGLAMTFLTYKLWGLFGWLLLTSTTLSEHNSLSISYFIAAFLVIGVSLCLNRKITFKTQARRHESKMQTIVNFYGVYCVGALAGALVTFVSSRYGSNISLNIIKLAALGSTVVINYLGQRFWIYK
jgi:putative flippase GtrA